MIVTSLGTERSEILDSGERPQGEGGNAVGGCGRRLIPAKYAKTTPSRRIHKRPSRFFSVNVRPTSAPRVRYERQKHTCGIPNYAQNDPKRGRFSPPHASARAGFRVTHPSASGHKTPRNHPASSPRATPSRSSDANSFVPKCCTESTDPSRTAASSAGSFSGCIRAPGAA